MNRKALSERIQILTNRLREMGRIPLAIEIEKYWNKSLLEYSKIINTYSAKSKMERYLKRAFEIELLRLGYSKKETDNIILDLDKNRIIQTAPHLIPSNGPRMFFIDWLSSLNLNTKKFYVVGMYSGIPFSNTFYPGHITFNKKIVLDKILDKNTDIYKTEIKKEKTKANNGLDEKISLIPSRIQDDLVYKSSIEQKTIEVIGSLTLESKSLFLNDELTKGDYTRWSLTCQKNINSTVLNKKNLVYVDMNEVVKNYLVEAFSQKKHILYRIFFNKKERKNFLHHFANEKIFVLPFISKKYPSNETLNFEGDFLMGKHNKIKINQKNIIELLKNGRLCPSTFMCFTVLSFLNDFKCLGSFRQAVYLPEYKDKWIKSKILYTKKVSLVPCCNLTTGHFIENEMQGIRPLDILIGTKFKINQKTLFGEILLNIENNLYS